MNITKTFFVGLLAVSSVFAVPTLQLDIDGGVYNQLTETTMITSTNFELVALLNEDLGFDITVKDSFYLSMAITPKIDQSLSLGIVLIDGDTINVTKDMTLGTPPLKLSDYKDIGDHGIFETYYFEKMFLFADTNKAMSYDVQTDPGYFESDPSGDLFFNTFAIDISGLNPDYGVHFDLYTKTDGKNLEFAPFSHDAEAVPEPATLSLFGMGLLVLSGMGLIHRRK